MENYYNKHLFIVSLTHLESERKVKIACVKDFIAFIALNLNLIIKFNSFFFKSCYKS